MDDLRERLGKVLESASEEPYSTLDALEAVARSHASERIDEFVHSADYCPYCGAHADGPHRPNCAIGEED